MSSRAFLGITQMQRQLVDLRHKVAVDKVIELDRQLRIAVAKLLDIGEGTSEVQRLVISRYIGC